MQSYSISDSSRYQGFFNKGPVKGYGNMSCKQGSDDDDPSLCDCGQEEGCRCRPVGKLRLKSVSTLVLTRVQLPSRTPSSSDLQMVTHRVTIEIALRDDSRCLNLPR